MLAETRAHPEKYWQHGAFAVADERGNLVAFARMDSPHGQSGDMSLKKAWTAARLAQNSDQAAGFLKRLGATYDDFLPGATSIAGGLVIFDPAEERETGEPGWVRVPFKKSCIGAIAASGVGEPQVDHEVAMVGLRYIQEKLWPIKVGDE
jgi:uncharacterized protein GlcG (DUF336 family)